AVVPGALPLAPRPEDHPPRHPNPAAAGRHEDTEGGSRAPVVAMNRPGISTDHQQSRRTSGDRDQDGRGPDDQSDERVWSPESHIALLSPRGPPNRSAFD